MCETGRILTPYRGFDSWSRTTELGRLELWRWVLSALVARTVMQLEVWNVSLKEYVTCHVDREGDDEPQNVSGPLKP